ncbi:hypothetical protein Ddye_011655 [Dipteronia dyeriana]|uniref:Uncharacterized protein n=1 Tax=Dipteronia dyeriana TaxID=168575 RepID=A0AAD9X2W3_9ROSI|nr:hypothetical protein Ddye_011655 [Dipteronia dyeriana]
MGAKPITINKKERNVTCYAMSYYIVGKEVVGYDLRDSKAKSKDLQVYVCSFLVKRRQTINPLPSRDHFNTKAFAADNDLSLPVVAVYFNA